ncbi:MAG: 4-hydroxyphenylpyruvate dioxygenase, partial [Iodobacter sp.]
MKLENPGINPLETNGFEFVEYTANTPEALSNLTALFNSLGFVEIARHRSKKASLFRQGEINFIVNGEPTQPASEFAQIHG